MLRTRLPHLLLAASSTLAVGCADETDFAPEDEGTLGEATSAYAEKCGSWSPHEISVDLEGKGKVKVLEIWTQSCTAKEAGKIKSSVEIAFNPGAYSPTTRFDSFTLQVNLVWRNTALGSSSPAGTKVCELTKMVNNLEHYIPEDVYQMQGMRCELPAMYGMKDKFYVTSGLVRAEMSPTSDKVHLAPHTKASWVAPVSPALKF